QMTMSDAEKGGFISKVSGLISKVIGPKRRWRAYKARVRPRPENHRTTVDGLERDPGFFGPVDGDAAGAGLEDGSELFAPAAADGTPMREIVGNDPVEFVEALVGNYEKGGYVTRERNRLSRAIERAAGEGTGNEGVPGNYEKGGYVTRERNRLSRAIEHAA